MALAVLPGGARFVSSSTTTRQAVDARCALERTFEVTATCTCSRRCPTACTLWSAADRRGPAVPRRRHARPPSGAHTAVWVAAVTPTASTSSAARMINRQGVERRQQGLVSTCAGTTASSRGGGDARRPAHPQRLTDEVRVWLLDGTLKNTLSCTPTGCSPSWRCPQPARALRLGRQDRQALQRQRRRRLRTFKHHSRRRGLPGAVPDGLRFVSGSLEATATSPTASRRSNWLSSPS